MNNGGSATPDLFKDKAGDWDAREMSRLLSAGIGRTIQEQVTLNEDMRVMDFGAGTGLISSHLAPRVKAIAAVDISAAMLSKLVEKPELRGKVTAHCQNILEQPLDDKFDLIVSAMAMHHVADTKKMLRTFAAHLKPGARVALADLDQEDGSFHPADVEGVYHHGFARDSFRSKLEDAGFSDIRFVTAHTVQKEDRHYPVFLALAVRA